MASAKTSYMFRQGAVDYNAFSNSFLPSVCFSGLSFQDLMFRQGAIDSPPKCPVTLGFECAGEVEKVGEGVEKFKVSRGYNF